MCSYRAAAPSRAPRLHGESGRKLRSRLPPRFAQVAITPPCCYACLTLPISLDLLPSAVRPRGPARRGSNGPRWLGTASEPSHDPSSRSGVRGRRSAVRHPLGLQPYPLAFGDPACSGMAVRFYLSVGAERESFTHLSGRHLQVASCWEHLRTGRASFSPLNAHWRWKKEAFPRETKTVEPRDRSPLGKTELVWPSQPSPPAISAAPCTLPRPERWICCLIPWSRSSSLALLQPGLAFLWHRSSAQQFSSL